MKFLFFIVYCVVVFLVDFYFLISWVVENVYCEIEMMLWIYLGWVFIVKFYFLMFCFVVFVDCGFCKEGNLIMFIFNEIGFVLY